MKKSFHRYPRGIGRGGSLALIGYVIAVILLSQVLIRAADTILSEERYSDVFINGIK